MVGMSSKGRILSGDRPLVYAVHDSRTPSDEEMAEYIEHIRRVLSAVPDPSVGIALSITDGGAPNARQRRLIVQAVQEICGDAVVQLRSSAISDSALVRSVVTALSWHIPEIRIFSPAKASAALQHVRVLATDVPLVIADLEELARPLDHARTVRLVIDQLRSGASTLRP